MRTELFINDEWVPTDGQRTLTLAYDGSVIDTVSVADAAAVDRAVAAAETGAAAMARLTNSERYSLLMRAHGLMERDAGKFARTIALETGKPIREARVECDRALQTLIESAVAARELSGEAIPMDSVPTGKGRMAMTVREPLGIIGAITPWNVPLNLALHKIGPAFAAGNSVVHKPSEITPLSALQLAALFQEAGLPAGAYNVLNGHREVGQMIVRDPRIAMIAFTGSVETGKWIRANAGLKKVTLELGGNCAVIVDESADLDLAATSCVRGAFLNSGQVCISVQRIFVHEHVREEFTKRVVDGAQALRRGHPLEEDADLTSLVTEQAAERVESWVREAIDKGARLLTGLGRSGAQMEATVITDLPVTARISCHEVFGPVVAINGFTDLNEAVREANATPYGLQAGVFTTSLDRAFEAARGIRVGGVMINDIPTFRADQMPYGGMKDSGLGREGPRYAIQEMTEVKIICWR
jgi:acyl-CoA reductase-like NAD-dependent aldehyde dehydrogenase